MIDQIELYRILDKYFTMDELHTVCFQLGVDIDDLGGVGQSGKARALVEYLYNRGREADAVTGRGSEHVGIGAAVDLKCHCSAP